MKKSKESHLIDIYQSTQKFYKLNLIYSFSNIPYLKILWPLKNWFQLKEIM